MSNKQTNKTLSTIVCFVHTVTSTALCFSVHERQKAKTLWERTGAVIMVVRRPGWLLCREVCSCCGCIITVMRGCTHVCCLPFPHWRRRLSSPLSSPSCRTLKFLCSLWSKRTLAKNWTASRNSSLGRCTWIRRSVFTCIVQKLDLGEILKLFLLYISEVFMGLKRGGCASPCSCVLVYGGTFGGPTGGVSGETSEVKDWS